MTIGTRMRYTQYREKLFSLLDPTEHTIMELTYATLDQKMRELCRSLYLGGEQCGCGEQKIAGLFDAFPAFSWMGASRLPAYPLGPESLGKSHTQPATQSPDAGMLGGHLLATRGARSGADGAVRALGIVSLFKAVDTAGNKTLRSGKTFEWRLPPGPAKPSDATRAAPLDSPPERIAMSGVHDHRPIWNFTSPQVANAVQQAAAGTWLGTATYYSLRHSGASVDMPRQHRMLDAVQKRGAWSQAKSMERY